MYIRVNYCNHTQTGPNSVIFSHTSFRFCMLVKLNNTYKYRVVNIIRDKAINVVEGGGMVNVLCKGGGRGTYEARYEGGHTLYGADKRGGRGENKAKNETSVLGSFKFNCLVPYSFTNPPFW